MSALVSKHFSNLLTYGGSVGEPRPPSYWLMDQRLCG